jgi:hypothetical protein
LIDAFKSQYHLDPHNVPNNDDRWVRTRAQPQTQFMREARARLNRHTRKVPLAVMVAHPWHYRGEHDKIDGNLRGLLLDLPMWSREGLVDAAVAAGYYRDGGTPETAWRALRDETEGKIDIWTYAWVPQTPADFTRDADLAQQLGARQMLLWEADYIDDRPNAAALKETMRRRAAP